MYTYEKAKDMVAKLGKALVDAEKFDGGESGYNAAGTRLRKVMQEIKVDAQEVRNIVSEIKAERSQVPEEELAISE